MPVIKLAALACVQHGVLQMLPAFKDAT